MINAIFLAAAILLASYSNLMIKARADHFNGSMSTWDLPGYFIHLALDVWTWTAVLSFIIATICWLLVVRRIDLSVAQPAMALTFVIVPLAASQLFNEPLPPLRVAGLVLIFIGVVFVARTS
jgi:multidrug transporter EmrE-like cation transporter